VVRKFIFALPSETVNSEYLGRAQENGGTKDWRELRNNYLQVCTLSDNIREMN
jgi:hypothetical protein